MQDELVRVERRGAVALWTLCREERRNAIHLPVVEGLERAVREALDDASVRAVVLTGQGSRAFISGADLSLLVEAARGGEAGARTRTEFNDRVRAVLDDLAALPLPVFAAIQGHVMGGGCEVAAACDVRVADATATFTFKHGAMGVTPGWGGLGRLCRLVPRGMASRLLLTGLPLGAEDAARAGLVDELVPPGQAVSRALELAEAAAQLAPEALASMKGLLQQAYAGDGRFAEAERATFATRERSADHADAVHAYAERRAPEFAPRPRTPLDRD